MFDTKFTETTHTLIRSERKALQFFLCLLSHPIQVYSCRLDSKWPTFLSSSKLCPAMSGYQEGFFILLKSLAGFSPELLSLFQRKVLFHAGSGSVCCAPKTKLLCWGRPMAKSTLWPEGVLGLLLKEFRWNNQPGRASIHHLAMTSVCTGNLPSLLS